MKGRSALLKVGTGDVPALQLQVYSSTANSERQGTRTSAVAVAFDLRQH